jgi:hypothetical protein
MNPKSVLLLSASLFVPACGGSSGSGVDVAGDGGADGSVPRDGPDDSAVAHEGGAIDSGGGGGDGGAADSGGGRDGGPTVGIDASAQDANIPDAGVTDGTASGQCFAACEAAHPQGASDGQLLLGDCCGGTCASSCTSGPCFAGSGLACESCAITPLKAGTCGANCRTPASGDCKAYVDCLLACP